MPAPEPVEGLFQNRDVAELVAKRLQAAFPAGRATIEDSRPHVSVVDSATHRRRRVLLRIELP